MDNLKTHLIHRTINICATSPLRLIKGSLSFLSLDWLSCSVYPAKPSRNSIKAASSSASLHTNLEVGTGTDIA